MKLWYSETSPYARKVRAVIAYQQLDGQIEFLEATSGLDKNSPHNRDNPDRKSTRLNSSHSGQSRMPSSA